MSEETNEEEVVNLLFKKRERNRSNLRKKLNDDELKKKDNDEEIKDIIEKEEQNKEQIVINEQKEDENEEDDDLNRDKFSKIKLFHQLNKQKKGISLSKLNKSQIDKDSNNENDNKNSSTSSSSTTTLSSHFSTSLQDPSGAIAHENIMNQFISEKLGLSKVEESTTTSTTSTYSIPEHLKNLITKFDDKSIFFSSRNPEGENVSERESEREGGGVSMTYSLAEVALPLKTKLTNIEETEKIIKKIKENDGNSSISITSSTSSTTSSISLPPPPSSSSLLYSRFHVDQNTLQNSLNSLTGTKTLSYKTISRDNKSKDKIAMENYKKNLKK